VEFKQLGSSRLTTERIHHATELKQEWHSNLKFSTSSSWGTQTRSQASSEFPRGEDTYFYHIIHSSVNHVPLQDFGLHLVEVPSLLTASLHTRSRLRSDLLGEDDTHHHKCRLQDQPTYNYPLHKITITLWLVAWRYQHLWTDYSIVLTWLQRPLTNGRHLETTAST